MATKEAEIVVGAELARLAKQHKVVVSPVDGDQPSLLIGLIEWARLLGLPVIAAGKSSESDFVWTPATNEVKAWGQTVVSKEVGQNFIPNDHHSWGDVLANRASVPFDLTTVPDLCEMGIVANHTGLLPDCVSLHAPMARTVELPSIFRPIEEGGILSGKGRVDMFNCLRRPDELSFAGGVFVVIEAPDIETGKLFAAKGIPTCPNGKYILIHNPVHLLGAEAAMSILSAVKLGTSCGGRDVRPVVDLIAIAQRQIEVGELFEIGTRHVISGLGHQLIGAKPMSPDNPLPYYLCAGAKVTRPIPKGKIVSCGDVEIDSNSILYQLRQSQDQHFFPH
jgi:predicted homoserine dehydrogenase-like protein